MSSPASVPDAKLGDGAATAGTVDATDDAATSVTARTRCRTVDFMATLQDSKQASIL